jgi:hypothetical protein
VRQNTVHAADRLPVLVDRAALQRLDQLLGRIVEMRCDIPDFVHQRIGGVPRAIGVTDVAVGEDSGQVRYGTGRKGGVVAR